MTNCFPLTPWDVRNPYWKCKPSTEPIRVTELEGPWNADPNFQVGMKSILLASSAVTFIDVTQNCPWRHVRYPTLKELCASWKGKREMLPNIQITTKHTKNNFRNSRQKFYSLILS